MNDDDFETMLREDFGDAEPAVMPPHFGLLRDAETLELVRPATADEKAAYLEACGWDGEAFVHPSYIVAEGRNCIVVGSSPC